jgi:hypothetical protein
MSISNIGHTTLHTPTRDLHLNNILHVPSANESLASVHRIASDNNAFLEFHPNFSSLRIGQRRQHFIKEDVVAASIH